MIPSTKTLIWATAGALLFNTLACAADMSCTNTNAPPDSNKRMQLVRFKNQIDTTGFPVKIPQANTQQIPFEDISICIVNPFLFESTTVFPDELSELVQKRIDCIDQAMDTGKGTLDGDTGLDVIAGFFSSQQDCTGIGS
jgi:hypothetical protein